MPQWVDGSLRTNSAMNSLPVQNHPVFPEVKRGYTLERKESEGLLMMALLIWHLLISTGSLTLGTLKGSSWLRSQK